MGKSGKKIKTDKINTLRKQYDAFLEDDKKRKDRNEYILGRLEEMRSSSALVKMPHKENSIINEDYYPSREMSIRSYFNKSVQIENSPRIFRNNTNIPTNSITKFEPSILREISKNYILIPKIQSCITNDVKYHNPQMDNTDADWKIKYNILNELKKKEKESTPDDENVIFEERHKSPIPVQKILNQQDNKIIDDITPKDSLKNNDNYKPINELLSNQSISNIVEKDPVDINTNTKIRINDEGAMQEMEITNKGTFQNSEFIENEQHLVPVNNKDEVEIPQQQFTQPELEKNTNMDIYNIKNSNTSQEVQNTNITKEKNPPNEKINQENLNNDSNLQQNNTGEYFEQDIKQEDYIINTEENSRHDWTNNDINNIHSSQILHEVDKDYTETQPVHDIQNYETNEISVISDQNINAEENEIINEHNEVIYNDNSEKIYEYEENNVDTPGYPADNENYTTNQYSYHDELQKEEQYQPEVNEHEESTEHFDPNYEQQYTDNYGNVMNLAQYDNQQYTVDNSYDTTQQPEALNVNYEDVQPNNENYEHMPSENTGIAYQNQEEHHYTNENENYVSQQYDTNVQQEYLTTDINNENQYAVEQEYIEPLNEQDIIKDVAQELDSEEGYVDNQNTILTDNTEKPLEPEVLPDKIESDLNVS